MDMGRTFWDRVETLLLSQKTNYRWLAESIVKKSETTVSGWHTNNILPRAKEAVAIAKALGTTVEFLVDGEPAAGWSPPDRIKNIVEDLKLLNDSELGIVAPMVHAIAAKHLDERHASGDG